MRIEYDKHKFLDEKREYRDILDKYFHDLDYMFFVPKKDETKKYPLDFQMLYNKVKDILDLRNYNYGSTKLELPKEVIRPVYYTKNNYNKYIVKC